MRIAILIFTILINTGCGGQKKSGELRIISLSPAITEIIYSIGGDKYLVGITDYCDWPPGIGKLKESVGDFSFPSLEKIATLNPSVILAAGAGQSKALTRLTNLGYNVRIFHPENIDELFIQINEIGKLVGKKLNAAKVVAKMKKKISEIPEVKGTIFIEVCSKPLICAAENTFMSSLCSEIGLKNIANFKNSYPQVSAEWLIRNKPDYILLTGSSEKEFRTFYPYLKKSHIIASIDPDTLVRPGPRIVFGIQELYRVINAIQENAQK